MVDVAEIRTRLEAAAEKTGLKDFSLDGQIEEVAREIHQRLRVYPNSIANRGMREGEAEYRIARLHAVKRTLEWLKANEAEIRAAAKTAGRA